jgi:hypothetical protein
LEDESLDVFLLGKVINKLLRLNKEIIETFDDHFVKFSYQMMDTDPTKRPSLEKTIEMIKNVKIQHNIDVEKEGYFTDLASKSLMFIFVGREGWNSYWVDNRGFCFLKRIKNDTYEIIVDGKNNYDTLTWNEDCWVLNFNKNKKIFKKSKKVKIGRSDGYFNNFDETYYFLKIQSVKSKENRPHYIIMKDSIRPLTQESNGKFKIGKQLFEWNGYCWKEIESKFDKLFIKKEPTKKEGYFQNDTRKIYIHLGITKKSKCFLFEGEDYFELKQTENLSSVIFNNGNEEINLFWCGYGWKWTSKDQELFFEKTNVEEENENAFFQGDKSIFMIKSSTDKKYFKISQDSIEIVELANQEIKWNGKDSWTINSEPYINQRLSAYYSKQLPSTTAPKIVVIGVSGVSGKI